MKSHEWASLDGNKATVGITNYAQVCSGEIAAIINVNHHGRHSDSLARYVRLHHLYMLEPIQILDFLCWQPLCRLDVL